MIRKGLHATAVVDVLGRGVIPESTVAEPLAVIYIGPSAALELGERNILYPHASIRIEQGWLRTGVEVSFGPGASVYEPRAGVEIGDYCMIGGGTMICGAEHGMETTTLPMRHQMPSAKKIVIEDDVWIGMRAVIMPGVTIGRGSVIGAGSVVTRDIPAFSVAWGTPCMVRSTRGN